MTMFNQTKDELQRGAVSVWERHGRKGTIAGATGVGKSRMAVLAAESLEPWDGKQQDILIVTPTEVLRDENWPAELVQWSTALEQARVLIVCYASVSKVRGYKFKLVIFDEVHHLTTLSAKLYDNNLIFATLGLTATPPKELADPIKYAIIREFAPVIFKYSLDQGVEDKIVADFDIFVVMDSLDSVSINIPAGTKDKPFLTTESAAYQHLSKIINSMQMRGVPANSLKFMQLKRFRFLCALPSKQRLAKYILDRLPVDKRIITFFGSIEQANVTMGEDVFHSKVKKGKKLRSKLEDFKEKVIDRIGVVNAVDEGHNIPDLDIAFIVQTNSNSRTIVQRIGRVVRIRPDHKALVIVLCTQGTQDESWVKKALEDINPQRITRVMSSEIYTGKFFAERF